MPAAAKEFTDLVKLVAYDKEVPVKYNVAMKLAKLYKDDNGGNIGGAKKSYPDESAATKKKYLAKAEKAMDDSKADRKAKKANK